MRESALKNKKISSGDKFLSSRRMFYSTPVSRCSGIPLHVITGVTALFCSPCIPRASVLSFS